MAQPMGEMIFWIAATGCLVAELLIIRSSVRTFGRQEAGRTRAHRAWEAVWIVLPAVALAFMLVATWRTISRPLPAHNHMDMASAPR